QGASRRPQFGAGAWKNCATSPVIPPMIEPLLCGIVLGLIPVTLVGLFVAAWNQYRRGSALGG
ncbi:MAG: hypothetical protein RLZZ533_1489, partial [Cyanobacteriota bacterium]